MKHLIITLGIGLCTLSNSRLVAEDVSDSGFIAGDSSEDGLVSEDLNDSDSAFIATDSTDEGGLVAGGMCSAEQEAEPAVPFAPYCDKLHVKCVSPAELKETCKGDFDACVQFSSCNVYFSDATCINLVYTTGDDIDPVAILNDPNYCVNKVLGSLNPPADMAVVCCLLVHECDHANVGPGSCAACLEQSAEVERFNCQKAVAEAYCKKPGRITSICKNLCAQAVSVYRYWKVNKCFCGESTSKDGINAGSCKKCVGECQSFNGPSSTLPAECRGFDIPSDPAQKRTDCDGEAVGRYNCKPTPVPPVTTRPVTTAPRSTSSGDGGPFSTHYGPDPFSGPRGPFGK